MLFILTYFTIFLVRSSLCLLSFPASIGPPCRPTRSILSHGLCLDSCDLYSKCIVFSGYKILDKFSFYNDLRPSRKFVGRVSNSTMPNFGIPKSSAIR